MSRAYSAFIAVLMLLSSGCAAMHAGGGAAPFKYELSGGGGRVEVLDADFDRAVDIAGIVSTEQFRNAEFGRSVDGARLRVFTPGGMVREADEITIEPVLVANKEREGGYGIVYRIEVSSDEPEALTGLDYFKGVFFPALDEYLTNNDVRTKTFGRYRVLADKGVPDRIPASIPVTYSGFKAYLDGLGVRDGYQGIWATSDRSHVVGLVRDETVPTYKYTGFVIESVLGNWSPGEIILRINNLQEGQATTGIYLLDNKVRFGAVFETGKDFLHATNSPDPTDPFLLVKEYPPAVFGNPSE